MRELNSSEIDFVSGGNAFASLGLFIAVVGALAVAQTGDEEALKLYGLCLIAVAGLIKIARM